MKAGEPLNAFMPSVATEISLLRKDMEEMKLELLAAIKISALQVDK